MLTNSLALRAQPIVIHAPDAVLAPQGNPIHIREVLQAIYEQDFLDCSNGFRPGRSAHDAIRALDRVVHRGEVNWVLEADILGEPHSPTRRNYPCTRHR